MNLYAGVVLYQLYISLVVFARPSVPSVTHDPICTRPVYVSFLLSDTGHRISIHARIPFLHISLLVSDVKAKQTADTEVNEIDTVPLQ